MSAIIPSTGRRPEPPVAWDAPAEAQTANTARLIQIRKVKAWPALMRFFQSSATAGEPVGPSAKGGRLLRGFFFVACQLPARTAATFSAIFWEAWTEASSNATSDRT